MVAGDPNAIGVTGKYAVLREIAEVFADRERHGKWAEASSLHERSAGEEMVKGALCSGAA